MQKLKKLIDYSFYTLLPLTVLSCVYGALSDSLTVITIALDSGLSIIVNLFSFYAIRVVLRQNSFTFPYGTGKLENFASFLYGTLLVPTSFFIIYFAIYRFMYPPNEIHFGWAQVPLIPQFIRSIALFFWTKSLLKHDDADSPMLHSYYVNFKVCSISDTGVVLSLITAFVLVSHGMKNVAYIIDSLVSFTIAMVMLYHGIALTVRNFKPLINLPLPETDQLKIMKVLTQFFDRYENIGNIYTHQNGKERIIEIEFYFNGDVSLNDIINLQEEMSREFDLEFEDMTFKLIPLKSEDMGKISEFSKSSVNIR